MLIIYVCDITLDSLSLTATWKRPSPAQIKSLHLCQFWILACTVSLLGNIIHYLVAVTCVPSSCCKRAARPNSPSRSQMHIFRMLLVTSPSTDTFLLEVIISSQASLLCSNGDWLWPRKCLLCMAAAEGEVCIYSVALQSPPFILGAESGNLVAFSKFQCPLNSQPTHYSFVTRGATTCPRKTLLQCCSISKEFHFYFLAYVICQIFLPFLSDIFISGFCFCLNISQCVDTNRKSLVYLLILTI